MGRALRMVAIASMVGVSLAGCSPDIPTDPTDPTPTPFPIPDPSVTASAFAGKMDGIFANVISSWKTQSAVRNVVINSSEGVASPGCVAGPLLGSFFTDELNRQSGSARERQMMQLFANASGNAWRSWQGSYATKLSYPSFASVNAPQASPTANVPANLSAGSADETGFSSDALASAVRAGFSTPSETESKAIDAAATSLAARFTAFKATTRIENVIGSGPVPSYNPPFSPAGPVVNGRGNGVAGTVFK